MGFLADLATQVRALPVEHFILTRLSWVLVLILVAVILFLIVKTAPALIKELKKVKKWAWIVLLLIVCISFLIRFLVVPHQHMMYCDESYYGNAARNILLFGSNARCFFDPYENKTECFNTKSTVGWNSFLVISYALFGTNDLVAIRTSAFFGAISVILIFILAYVVFGNEMIGLMSALLLCLFPQHALWSGTSEVNVFVLFLALLMFIGLSIYFKTNSKWTHWLSIGLFLLMIQVKFEYFLFIISFLLIYFLKRRTIKSGLKEIIVPWAIGIPSLVCFVFEASLSFIDTNATYSVNLFLANSLQEFTKIFAGHYFSFAVFVLGALGLIIAMLERWKRDLTLTITAPLILLFGLYVAFPYGGQSRYFIIVHWLFLVYAPFFVWSTALYLVQNLFRISKKIFNKGQRWKNHNQKYQRSNFRKSKKPDALLIIICSVVLVLVFSLPIHSVIKEIEKFRPWPYYSLATRVPTMLKKDFNESCIFITQNEEADIISASVHNRVITLEQIMSDPGLEITNQFAKDHCVLYYKGLICTRNEHSRHLFNENEKFVCKFAEDYLELEKLKSYSSIDYYSNISYTVFQVKGVRFKSTTNATNNATAPQEGQK